MKKKARQTVMYTGVSGYRDYITMLLEWAVDTPSLERKRRGLYDYFKEAPLISVQYPTELFDSLEEEEVDFIINLLLTCKEPEYQIAKSIIDGKR
jgi:hypothetical protein